MPNNNVQMEFHISREARNRYQFDETLFALNGNVILANFHAVRLFALKMNQQRDLINFPEQAVRAGQINAMGLIDEILHYVAGLYRAQIDPQAMAKALDWLNERVGRQAVDRTLLRLVQDFPPIAVHRRELAPDEYLDGETAGVPHRQVALEELLLLWLANANPAFAPFLELFDDARLEKETAYKDVIAELERFWAAQPTFGPDDQSLFDLLRSPAIAVPHSLPGQLEYIRQRWADLLGRYLYRLLSGLDLIAEEQKAIFAGAGPARVPSFIGLEPEVERFSPDQDWMPHLVLIAKNVYVWLDQLSKRYGEPIHHLDQVPDEELARLGRWGLTGLWLIGLWERSRASQRIKQLCGNPEAVASAYSLAAYDVAHDLGGRAAYERLKARAWRHGVRLASDMVPNHMGIDSPWVIEHPDWFVGLDHSPFPSYSFSGPDLSHDERVSIRIEDHYYDRTDAAVVFQRVDRWSGHARYIYHGNDGTSMPWNDTAQLDYLNPSVREAVIETILHVARMFPVIRFDAAMTLARRHYQRLWFPEPGSGGAIPSRAEHGMTREAFEAAMPVEFWREVVDRVAQEAPDTLLLAEAFWLMEGYFVRTLGMHRVYNSAFMNMLRDEENANYRSVIKNTLEFDPRILKRYVNFMNNPDERTAVDQFGKGDKYFGICTMMATMPGLPMFGHGQIEGLAEKYGMEYRRAYWDEQPDRHLVERHEREVFPLLRRRALFSGVDDFYLYDVFAPDGTVNEDVFAYSNRIGDERALVIYHNRYAQARGWIRTSVTFAEIDPQTGDKTLAQRTLGQGLGLPDDGNAFVIFRDHVGGLEYIRNCRDVIERGLYVELEAYKCHVMVDFRVVVDTEWGRYGHLTDYLAGRGVPSIEETLHEVLLQPVLRPFRELVSAPVVRALIEARAVADDDAWDERAQPVLARVADGATTLLREAARIVDGQADPAAIAAEVERRTAAALQLATLQRRFPLPRSRKYRAAVDELTTGLGSDPAAWGPLFAWIVVGQLGRAHSEQGYEIVSRSWIDEWLLGRTIAGTFQELGLDEATAWQGVSAVKLMTTHRRWFDLPGTQKGRAGRVLRAWLSDGEVQAFIGVNRHRDILWFHQESFDRLLWWMLVTAAIEVSADPGIPPAEAAQRIVVCYDLVRALRKASAASGYQVQQLIVASAG